jgi:anti-sigma B factor antagonist
MIGVEGPRKEEPVALSLSRHDDSGTIVVSAVGDLDLVGADTFEQELATVIGTGAGDVVVDLSEVAFVDSAGINALLKGRRMAEEHGGTFRVARASGLVREVLEMTGVWSHLSELP